MKNLRVMLSIIIFLNFYLIQSQVRVSKLLTGLEVSDVSKIKIGKEYLHEKPSFIVKTSLNKDSINIGYVCEGIQKENWIGTKSKNSGILFLTKKNRFLALIKYKYRDFLATSNLQWAIQGEILLQEGIIPNNTSDIRKFRTALTHVNSKKIFILKSRKMVSITNFAKILKDYGFYNAVQINERTLKEKESKQKNKNMIYIYF